MKVSLQLGGRTWVAAAVATALGLTACGGGGGGGNTASTNAGPSVPSAPQVSTLSGTTAFGAPLANAAIHATGANGATASTTASSDGSYSLDVTNLQAPILITATALSGDIVKTYTAVVPSLPAPGSSATANVTPLTHAVAALVSSNAADPQALDSAAKLASLSAADLTKASALIKAALASNVSDLGLPAGFDPLTSAFVANTSNPADRLLETIKVAVDDQGVTLTNALVPVAASDNAAATATVTLADVNAATPAALAKATLNDGYISRLSQLRTQLNACLALAPADRISVDGSGNVTAFKGACNGIASFDAAYKHDGATLLSIWGKHFSELPQGASVQPAEIIGSFANDNGQGSSVLFRLPVAIGAAGTSLFDYVGETGSGWKVTGNQKKYRANISFALRKIIDGSPRGFVPTVGPDKGKDTGSRSRYELAFRFQFNDIKVGEAAEDVYAVRVSGPGLPANGMVLLRSTACGPDNYLSIANDTGVVPPPPATAAMASYTTAQTTAVGGNLWRIGAAPIANAYTGTDDYWNALRGRKSDGSPVDFAHAAPAPVSLASVPEFAAYKFEVFKVGQTTPDIEYRHLIERPVGIEFAKQFEYAAPGALSAQLLDPASNRAGMLSSATVDWSLPAGAPVVFQASFGSSGQQADGSSSNITASSKPAQLGDTSLTVTAANEANGLGAACPSDKFNALTVAGGSREVYLYQYGDRGLRVDHITSYQGRPSPITSFNWNIFDGSAHPAAPGSTLLANGATTQWEPTSISVDRFTATGGEVVLDTLANTNGSEQSLYVLKNVFDTSASYPKTVTAIAKVRGSNDPTARVMDFDFAFGDAGALGARVALTIRDNQQPWGFSALNTNGSATAHSGDFSTTPTSIYQFAITITSPTAGTVKVYRNGQGPIMQYTLVGDMRQTSNPGDNHIRFGDGSSTQRFAGAMDWLVWTTAGAFTPQQLANSLPSSFGAVTGY